MRLAIALVALTLGASPAFAHKLYVEPKAIGDRIRVEAFYGDNTPAQEARITVLNGDTVVAEGRTDDNGVWICPLPPGSYMVKAETLGHASEPQPVTVTETATKSPEPAVPAAPDDHAEQTRTPWGRLAVGLGIIVVASALGLLVKRSLRHGGRN